MTVIIIIITIIIIIIIIIINPSENASERSFSRGYLIFPEDGNSTSQIPPLVVRRKGLPTSYPRYFVQCFGPREYRVVQVASYGVRFLKVSI